MCAQAPRVAVVLLCGIMSTSLYVCWDKMGISVYGLVPSLIPFSQQDGPGDVRAADLGARGSDSLHHSPATWKLGAASLLP